jgi:hypothetical protein
LYNAGNQPVDLSGYYITDNRNNVEKWAIPSGVSIPANGYLLFWADGKDKIPGDQDSITYTNTTNITIADYHLSFKLSSEGEFIGLYSPHLNSVDTVSYGKQAANISFGRKVNPPYDFAFLAEPTPLQQNANSAASNYVATKDPTFSIHGGRYPNAQLLTINHSSPNVQIYYTTDGSIPSSNNSNLYTSPLNISFTQTIRCKAFINNQLPSNTSTQTYLINENITLPTLAISTNHAELWSFDFGIFQKSLKNRAVPISIEYFNPSGNKEFGFDAGMKIFGTTIYQLQQKPMAIQIKGKYGTDFLSYQLFDNKKLFNFKNFSLRNGGNDNGQTLFTDGLITSLVANKMDIDYQAYQPTLVFINGQYWGVYNIREKLNDDYLATNNSLNPSHLTILENNAEINVGDNDEYNGLLNFVRNNDLSLPANYNVLKANLDINEYINYKITKMYMGYWLADLNNKYWKGSSPHEKWRWILFDLEHSFGKNGSDDCHENTLVKISTLNDTLPEWSTILLTKLMDNSSFKNEFIQRSASYLNTLFKTETVLNTIDSLSTKLAPEMPRHISKWSSDPFAIPSIGSWHSNITILKSYAQCRPNEVRKHIMERFSIADTFQVSIQIPAEDTGKIFINNVQIMDTLFTGTYFSNIPLTLRAVPGFGYQFTEWLNITPNDTLSLTLTQDTILKPVFNANPTENILPTHISSNTLITQLESPYLAMSDLIVDSNVTLTLAPGAEIRMADETNIIVYGSLITNGTELNKAIIRSNPHEKARRPCYNTTPRWGALNIHEATDTSRLSNLILSNTSFGKNRLIHKAGISAYKSNVLIDSIEIKDAYQPFYSEYGSVSIQNSILNTHLSTDVIHVKYADSVLVKNCTIKGNDAEDTDAIDFDGVNNGAIINNKIYNFFGYNSDGIDLGENSMNILIAKNKIFNCADKGISIGQGSTANVAHNVIYNCSQGLGIKDSNSFANIDHNTFFQNDYAIASFEKNLAQGGGNVVIQNSILAGSHFSSYFVDEISTLNIAYSLSNTEDLTNLGTGIVFDAPQFANAGLRNFELKTTSPCIDTGNPLSLLDSNNTITDMGAYYTHIPDTMNTIIINEINYKSLSTLNSEDWIELYNYGNNVVDLSGWNFTNKNATNVYTFEENLYLLPHHFLILCNDTNLFNDQYANTFQSVGNFSFNLESTDQLKLFNADMELIYFISYSNKTLWSDQANGKGCTLELDATHIDYSVPFNWHQSNITQGTPGEYNSEPNPLRNLFINEFMANNTQTYSLDDETYEDWIEIYNGNSNSIDIGGLFLTDDFQKKSLWQIPRGRPDSTTIPPNGHLVLLADKHPFKGVLHLNFKLDRDGDQIGLSQLIERDEILLDSTNFSIQKENITFGRFPDGSSNWNALYPTPNSSNVLFESFSLTNLTIYPNPSRNYLNIAIKNAMEHKVSIELYNSSGQLILKKKFKYLFNKTIQRFDLSTISNGSYLLKVISKDEIIVKKIIKVPVK